MLEMYPLFIHNLWINSIINVENYGISWKLLMAVEKFGEKRKTHLPGGCVFFFNCPFRSVSSDISG